MENVHVCLCVETGIGVCECMCMFEVRWGLHV